MRAVIYARLSEDHERAESVPTQIANGTRYAERMGWDVVHVFKDEGRSGIDDSNTDLVLIKEDHAVSSETPPS